MTPYVMAMKPVTPGEILLEDYLIPLGLSQNALGRGIGVSPRAINEIVLGKRSITPEKSLEETPMPLPKAISERPSGIR